MAGDWIKMRPSLMTSPRVNGIARVLESDPDVARVLATGYNGEMSQIVTRSVMRSVTIASLLVIWGSANEHTTDGIFHDADLCDLDDMVGIPGFGEAMAFVGWAIYDEHSCTVTLPNFCEYNTSGKERSANAKTGAERQREYRERLKAQNRDVTGDVTGDVTSNRRVEERRVEEKDTTTTTTTGFAMHCDWIPSPFIEFDTKILNTGAVKTTDEWLSLLPEFTTYWASRPDAVATESKWQNILIKSITNRPSKPARKRA